MSEQAHHVHEKPAHGSICWNELATKDAGAAKKFYTELFGWKLQGSEAGGMDYTEVTLDGKPFGGIMQMSAEMSPMPSHWMTYVAVDDVDATVKRVEELGGKTCVPPQDIPHVGRFSVITDPTGANIAVITLNARP